MYATGRETSKAKSTALFQAFLVLIKIRQSYIIIIRARQRAGRPGPEIFDPGFFDPEKNLRLNPEPGPDFQIINPETGPKPGNPGRVDPARKNPALCRALPRTIHSHTQNC